MLASMMGGSVYADETPLESDKSPDPESVQETTNPDGICDIFQKFDKAFNDKDKETSKGIYSKNYMTFIGPEQIEMSNSVDGLINTVDYVKYKQKSEVQENLCTIFTISDVTGLMSEGDQVTKLVLDSSGKIIGQYQKNMLLSRIKTFEEDLNSGKYSEDTFVFLEVGMNLLEHKGVLPKSVAFVDVDSAIVRITYVDDTGVPSTNTYVITGLFINPEDKKIKEFIGHLIPDSL